MMRDVSYSNFRYERPNLWAQLCCMGDAVVNKDVSENSCDEQLTRVDQP